MKKRTMYVALIFTIILTCLVVYFAPMKLSDCLDSTSPIHITITELGVRDGAPFIYPVVHSDITGEQEERVLALCSQYSYRRTIHTLFSDGSLSRTGNKIVSIFSSAKNETLITVSLTGKVAINGKPFKMSGAEQFIDQLTAILDDPLYIQS